MNRVLRGLMLCLSIFVLVPSAHAGKKKGCADNLVTPGVLKCVLSAGARSVSMQWNLADGELEEGRDEGMAMSDELDLSMHIDTYFDHGNWRLNVFLSSASIQDEFTNLGYEFAAGARGEVARETIEKDRTPDGKDYVLTCTVEND